MKGIDAQFLAPSSHILCCQHSSVRRGLVAIRFDFHAAGDTSDGFAATGITQISLRTMFQGLAVCFRNARTRPLHRCNFVSLREIGDMDEGVVEGSEDSGNTEDKFTWLGCQ